MLRKVYQRAKDDGVFDPGQYPGGGNANENYPAVRLENVHFSHGGNEISMHVDIIINKGDGKIISFYPIVESVKVYDSGWNSVPIMVARIGVE